MSQKLQRLPVLLVLALPLLLFQSSCDDGDLEKISKALIVVANVQGEIQTAVITANSEKLISDDTTRSILEVCLKINTAGKEATEVTRTIAKMNATSKSQMLSILKPVISAIDNSIKTDLISISDQPTKDKIRLMLLSVQTTLNSVQIMISGGE